MPYAQLLSAIAALAIAFALFRLLLTPLGRRLALDHPNERSLHASAVPRTGGLAIAAAVAAASVLVGAGLSATLGAALVVAAVSLADDLRGLPSALRLITHLAAAALTLAIELPGMEPLMFVLLVLGLAWYANLYNFMDGADGLAGGMAVFGFGSYAFATLMSGHTELGVLSAALAGAATAFLFFNFHPARIFLGDVGSVPLGFLAGAIGLLGWRDQAWPLWFPVLVFAPFVGDATLTLLKRLLRRERVWRAHREHYYQRLVRMGFGHRGTALVEYTVMAAVSATALAVREADALVQGFALGFWVLALGALAVWIDVRWVRFLRASAA